MQYNNILNKYTYCNNLNIVNTIDSNIMTKIYSCENLFDLDTGLFLFDEEIEHKYNLHKSKKEKDCICHNISSNI